MGNKTSSLPCLTPNVSEAVFVQLDSQYAKIQENNALKYSPIIEISEEHVNNICKNKNEKEIIYNIIGKFLSSAQRRYPDYKFRIVRLNGEPFDGSDLLYHDVTKCIHINIYTCNKELEDSIIVDVDAIH